MIRDAPRPVDTYSLPTSQPCVQTSNRESHCAHSSIGANELTLGFLMMGLITYLGSLNISSNGSLGLSEDLDSLLSSSEGSSFFAVFPVRDSDIMLTCLCNKL